MKKQPILKVGSLPSGPNFHCLKTFKGAITFDNKRSAIWIFIETYRKVAESRGKLRPLITKGIKKLSKRKQNCEKCLKTRSAFKWKSLQIL